MYQLHWLSIPLDRYATLLAKYLQPLRGQVFVLALLIFAATGLQLLTLYIIRHFIDTGVAGGLLRDLLLAAAFFIGSTLLYQGLAVGQAYLAEKTAWQATNALRSDLTRHCLYLDMSFHNNRTPGELIERIDGDVGTLANFFSRSR